MHQRNTKKHDIMKQYNYNEAICEDIRSYFNENNINASDYESRDEMYEDLYDKLWVEDSVTGNASGSYTMSAWKAEENLCHNLDLLGQAIEEFGDMGDKLLSEGAEACDVTIRCWLLSECLNEVIDELFPNFWDED